MTILGAAVIDDILGLIILSLVLGLGQGGSRRNLRVNASIKDCRFFFFSSSAGLHLVPVIMGWSAKSVSNRGDPYLLNHALVFALIFNTLVTNSRSLHRGIMVKRTKYSYQLIQGIETLGNLFFPSFLV